MSLTSLSELLSDSAKDDAFVRHLLSVWPHIDSILQAFSTATRLPIFVFFNDTLIFRTPPETMPPFCQKMLDAPETASLCMKDGQRRAIGAVPELQDGVQMCHAGMLNGRREIETGIGTLAILFGSKKSVAEEALRRRGRVVQRLAGEAPALAAELERASASEENAGEFEDGDLALMNAITDIIQRLIIATAGFHFQTFNMAHELSLMLISMGLYSEDIGELAASFKGEGAAPPEAGAQLLDAHNMIHTQCRLGLYIVRNFLSHANETKYREVVKPQFVEVNLEDILTEMVELHRPLADEKRVEIVIEKKDKDNKEVELPPVLGFDMELRRLFYNVISNAIKYSYHSIPKAQRIIRVKLKVPYDPGFKKPRFAVAVENYGLGLSEDERRSVFRAGFRGQQAIEEVPIGSGIGLSEAAKIMRLHNGEIRMHSKRLHQQGEEQGPYLTTVDLIFPYAPRRSRRP